MSFGEAGSLALAAYCVGGPKSRTGASPLWTGSDLSWVDVGAARLHAARWRASRPAHYLSLALDLPLAAVAPIAGGHGWVGVAGASVVALRRDGGLLAVGAVGDCAGGRLTEVACDQLGRLWAVMALPDGGGALYRFSLGGVATRVPSCDDVSGGIGWSPNGDRLYLVDRVRRAVLVADVDVFTGEPGPSRPFVHFEAEPHGLTVDADGGIWVALGDACQVRRHLPDGTLGAVVGLRVRPTGCAFVGPDLATLVITTAHGPEWGAGQLFQCAPGVRGLPARTYVGHVGPVVSGTDGDSSGLDQ